MAGEDVVEARALRAVASSAGADRSPVWGSGSLGPSVAALGSKASSLVDMGGA
jgi:hypothetical protein